VSRNGLPMRVTFYTDSIPVGIIAEGIVGGISWLLNYAGVIDQTYTICTLAVSAWYAL